MRLEGKVALVTGASQGIGEAIARRYSREGAAIAVNYVQGAAKAQALVSDLEASGGRAVALQANVADLAAIRDLVARTVAHFGRIDILVNNAGRFRTVSVEDTTEEIWDEQLDLNLKGTFFAVQAALPHFRKQGRGKVVNVSSIFGTGAGPNCPAYCASKGGVVNLTRALACELGRENINVNSIAPGNIATPLNAHLRTEDSAEYLKLMRTLTPTGRDFLQPEELTGAAVFLASADSDAVHGVSLLVDAGWSAW